MDVQPCTGFTGSYFRDVSYEQSKRHRPSTKACLGHRLGRVTNPPPSCRSVWHWETKGSRDSAATSTLSALRPRILALGTWPSPIRWALGDTIRTAPRSSPEPSSTSG